MLELSSYCENELYLLDRKQACYHALPEEDKKLFANYPARLEAVSQCVITNHKFLQQLVEHGAPLLPQSPEKDGGAQRDDESENRLDPAYSVSAVRALLHAVARDWSADGARARKAAYAPVLAAVADAHALSGSPPPSDFTVLVAAAGTGRLCWELVKQGFSVEGCEERISSLLASNFFLNHASANTPVTLHPFAHEHRNVRRAADTSRFVAVPDVDASSAPEGDARFGIRTGSFLDVYTDAPGVQWNVVVSCLAFDLVEDIVLVMRSVQNLLKPGGAWVFLGPAHCENVEDLFSPQLAVSEFVDVVRESGFRVVKESDVEVPVSEDAKSLKTRTLVSKFFVAVKL